MKYYYDINLNWFSMQTLIGTRKLKYCYKIIVLLFAELLTGVVLNWILFNSFINELEQGVNNRWWTSEKTKNQYINPVIRDVQY